MNKEFPFVEIPSHLLKHLGEADAGTRLYRVYGKRMMLKLGSMLFGRFAKVKVPFHRVELAGM